LFNEHKYFQNPNNKAEAFWQLISFYDWQKPAECSLTSSCMVVNALMASRTREENFTTDDLLAKSSLKQEWKSDITEPCLGVSFDNLEKYLKDLFKQLNLDVSVEAVRMTKNAETDLEKFHNHLKRMNNEKDYYVVANYVQTDFFKWEPDEYGHFSSLGAFDEANQKVLILDVYRYTSEPHNSIKGKGPFPPRGYLVIKKRQC